MTKGVTLVHFACHGADAVGKQAIYLEGDLPLSSDTILGMDSVELAFQEKKPLVYLNACEAGRLAADLVGIGGFAD